MTEYNEIFERFCQKITDYKLLELSDEDVREMMTEWLGSAISKFKRCASDLSDRDDIEQKFNVTLQDSEKEILAIMMVDEWLEPQLNSVLYTSQFIGGKNEKFYSPANQLEKLMALSDRTRVRARKLITAYTYQNNDYLKS